VAVRNKRRVVLVGFLPLKKEVQKTPLKIAESRELEMWDGRL